MTAMSAKVPAYEETGPWGAVTGKRLACDFPAAFEFAFGLPRGMLTRSFLSQVEEAIERNIDDLGFSAARRVLNGECTGGVPAVKTIPPYAMRRVEIVLRMLDVMEVMAAEGGVVEDGGFDHAVDSEGRDETHEEGEHAGEAEDVGGGGELGIEGGELGRGGGEDGELGGKEGEPEASVDASPEEIALAEEAGITVEEVREQLS